MKKLLVRLQNKKILLSVISGVLLIMVQLGVIDMELSHKADIIIDVVLSMLVGLGIVSDPESHVKK